MRVEIDRSSYDFKKHIIHVLVTAAMAMSWMTVHHVNSYMHSHLRANNSRKTSTTRVTGKLNSKTTAPMMAGAMAIAEKMGISITDTQIDRNFIRGVEGSALKGYVPLATTTQSGVTIADGFDIGQMSVSEFNQLPIGKELKAKLLPYVGLTKVKARDYLKAHPLTITEDELQQLNVISANKDLQPLIQAYNKDSPIPFTKLPSSAQTAIFSYAYQYGPGFMHTSKMGADLWKSFITQNWKRAGSILRTDKMYASRRGQEASLLEHLA